MLREVVLESESAALGCVADTKIASREPVTKQAPWIDLYPSPANGRNLTE